MKIFILALFGLLAFVNSAPQFTAPRSIDGPVKRHENTKDKREANPEAWDLEEEQVYMEPRRPRLTPAKYDYGLGGRRQKRSDVNTTLKKNEEEEAVNKSRSMTLNMQDILTKVVNSTRIKFLFVPQMNYNPGCKLINIQYEPKPQINTLLSEIYKLEFLFKKK